METISFTLEDGTTEEFYVEELTRVNGTDYLLVSRPGDGDEDEALILKDISDETSEEAAYVVVEDPDELTALLKVFSEMMEDTSILL